MLKTMNFVAKPIVATTAIALLAVCLLPAVSSAAIVQLNSINGTSKTFYPVSASDLINDGQPTFSGQSTTGTPGGSSNATNLNNGSAGTGALSSGAYYPAQVWTTTFDLDITTNTLGYDITGIGTFTGWTNANVWQNYELLVSVVGDASFTTLGTFNIVPFNISGNSETSTRIELTDDTGTIVTGVDAVRFAFPSENAGISAVYREIDILGIATVVPEPSSLALLALASVSMLFGFRKREC